ncbi:glycosyltransferase [Pleomorphomonas sp. NRK KF1]|uniref:glycosyltransferase n=1 Tax=Pleomorphomonas sp. NRK KF1 TaxID=2943000 RepID=UPI002043FFAB|nr:glycosyltransferase [Pleomorphomonas sp. NRK KF1]MCM5553451.1 glycosyltransferase [Pleomorphomonas sp. NRK KF1]
MEGGRRPTILHISSDYLDPIRPPPITDAVVRLVDRMTDHPQVVVSLQRVVDPRRVEWRDFGDFQGRRLIVHRYFAPPFGIGMAACQFAVARRIGRFLAAERIRPDVVHTHRFTFEGIAGWLLARRFKAALFCSMRGEVERKVFRSKPTYRPWFRRIARDAARIYHVSAWYRDGFERYTGVDPRKTDLLPNIVFNARPVIEPAMPRPIIVSPMSLRAVDKKGLPELLVAFARVRDRLPDVNLEVIGEGPEDALARVRALIVSHGLEGRVLLRDFMPHKALLEHLREALAMALPSHQETFGMVYPEALFAGTPILHTLGSGIDGYLDGLDVGVGVRPGNMSDIAAALVKLVENNAAYRTRIAAASGVLYERLAPERTIARYRAAVADAIRTSPRAAASGR